MGEVLFQHHPDYDALLPEMLEYAEIHLRNEEKNLVFSPIYDYDEALVAAVKECGYQRIEGNTLWDSIYTIDGEIPQSTLPDDYRLASMADDGSDIDRRRKAFGLGFNHLDPHDWPSRLSYEWLQQAADYRADLDIYVVAPNGEYASFCLGWWDEVNKIVRLEPVGTVAEHRCIGLVSAAVFEAIRQAAALGAGRAFVGSTRNSIWLLALSWLTRLIIGSRNFRNLI